MGTLFEVLLIGDDEEHLVAVAEAVLDEVQRIDRLLSRFDPASEIYRLNRLAGRGNVLVDREVADLLAFCQNACIRTGGAFDITAGCSQIPLPLGEGGERSSPGEGRLHRDVARAGFQLNVAKRTVSLAPGCRLDLGGIGKGFALDRAGEILAENGIENALLHGGTSSVLARGLNQRGESWRVQIAGGPSHVNLQNAALSCSEVSEQADIVDPRTGQPMTDAVACAVIARSATDAEIWSTAAVVLGEQRTRMLLKNEQVELHWFELRADSGSC